MVKRQTATDVNNGGKPGAVIYIPPTIISQDAGFIDISYLKLWVPDTVLSPSSIRFNTPAVEWAYLHQNVGRVVAAFWSIFCYPGDEEHAGAAFYVKTQRSAARWIRWRLKTSVLMACTFIDDGLGNNDPEK